MLRKKMILFYFILQNVLLKQTEVHPTMYLKGQLSTSTH